MNIKKNIFITGATGFLGSFLILELLRKTEDNLYLLVRAPNEVDGLRRILVNVQKILNLSSLKQNLKRIKICNGDITKPRLDLSDSDFNFLNSNLDEAFHCAAITDFNVPSKIIESVNENGTREFLDLCFRIRKNGRLNKINHVSTTYVVGNPENKSVFFENELQLNQKFNNLYEKTKYNAELIVNEFRLKGLPVNIFRTSVLCGDSTSGTVINFQSIYKLIKILSLNIYNSIPALTSAIMNLIPVDEAARAICLIAKYSDKNCQTYHICNRESLPFGFFLKEASIFYKFKEPALIPIQTFNFKTITAVQKQLLAPFFGYLNYQIHFDSTNSSLILDKFKFSFSKMSKTILKKMFLYCHNVKFVKKNKSGAVSYA